jgi:hypothetical protein
VIKIECCVNRREEEQVDVDTAETVER